MSIPDRIDEGGCPGGIVTRIIVDGEIIASIPVATDADLVNAQAIAAAHPDCDVVSYDGDTGRLLRPRRRGARVDLGLLP